MYLMTRLDFEALAAEVASKLEGMEPIDLSVRSQETVEQVDAFCGKLAELGLFAQAGQHPNGTTLWAITDKGRSYFIWAQHLGLDPIATAQAEESPEELQPATETEGEA